MNDSCTLFYSYHLKNSPIRGIIKSKIKLTYPFILNGDLDDNDLSQSKYSTYTNGRLTSHSIIGGTAKTCYYDTLGNPVAYLGKNASWSHGHRLDSFDGINFEYNANGIRTKKTNGSDITKFILDGDRIVMTESTSSGTMKFYYGADGLTAFESSGNKYFYQKNIFGDIIGIYDNNFNWVARYVYDAWGNCKVVDEDGSELIYDATSIAHKNPFRYRGYYYDRETGFYYLNARYYDPQVGRFISPDDISYLDPTTINGLNLYAYCANNPVNRFDPSGHFSINSFLFGPIGNPQVVHDINKIVQKDGLLRFYKGVPVFVIPDSNLLSSFSFGAIFLEKSEVGDSTVLNHEWGHTRQMLLLGVGDFFNMIGIPSLICAGLSDGGNFFDVNYYKFPWEITADMFGDVTRNEHNNTTKAIGIAYLAGAEIVSNTLVKPMMSPVYTTAAALIDGIIPGLGTTLLAIMYTS